MGATEERMRSSPKSWDDPASFWGRNICADGNDRLKIYGSDSQHDWLIACDGPRVKKAMPNRCPTGMKTDVLRATATQAKIRVVACIRVIGFDPVIRALNP
jgi:hypothetical protein